MNSPHTIGSYLKQIREEKDIALKVISRRTKISITMLEFLEGDRLDEMPNRAYVRGYVKSYSKELGIDPREALKLLDLTYQGPTNNLLAEEEETPAPPVKQTPTSTTNLHFPPISTLSIAGAIFAVVIFVVIIKASGDKTAATPEPTPITQQILSDKTPLKLHKAVEVEVGEQVEAEKKIDDNKEDEPKDKINFYNAFNPLYSIEEKPDKESLELLPPYIKKQMVKGKQNLYISAYAGGTWLTYKKDNEEIRKVLLEKGQNLFISGDELRLFFGNVGATKIFLNNQLLSTPTRTGVKSLIIPIENQKKYKLPLFVFENDGKDVSTSDEYIKAHPIESN